ncbi:MAG: 2Fe-2S iron-sulfur cluster binding domain-containing protein [Betaproteobacteria bacterium]|nr:2Fe-2S iron-sulfur cluster binding domain-containing protein [Betaproteobacteria bacterium]
MSFTIRVANTDVAFTCDAATTILDAARNAGYEMPYSCRRGACASCRGLVRSGEVDTPYPEDLYVLFCQTRPRSDLEIVPREIRRIDPKAKSTLDARVLRVIDAADDVKIVQLRFSAGVRVKFKAGQYLDVILADAARRSFSLANAPQQSDLAVLHVRVVQGGRFSEEILPKLAPGDTLRVELPAGDFWLRESAKPALFVASGTGFAPVKSMLEDAFRRGSARQMTLYWGARRQKDLYLADLPHKWAAQYPQFRFVPVLSEPDAGWTGRTGLVHRAVMEDHATLAACVVYACGVAAMVDAARRDFCAERNLPADDFYCDVFVTPADIR